MKTWHAISFEKNYCMFSFHKIMLVDELKEKQLYDLPKYYKHLQTK